MWRELCPAETGSRRSMANVRQQSLFEYVITVIDTVYLAPGCTNTRSVLLSLETDTETMML